MINDNRSNRSPRSEVTVSYRPADSEESDVFLKDISALWTAGFQKVSMFCRLYKDWINISNQLKYHITGVLRLIDFVIYWDFLICQIKPNAGEHMTLRLTRHPIFLIYRESHGPGFTLQRQHSVLWHTRATHQWIPAQVNIFLDVNPEHFAVCTSTVFLQERFQGVMLLVRWNGTWCDDAGNKNEFHICAG